MRILSLLPSATEIVHALGLGDDLVGVTHECDVPPEVQALPKVTRSVLPANATPAVIDRLVSEAAAAGSSTYFLDTDLIGELSPDLILTQDLCAVCAMPVGHLRAVLDVHGIEARVVSLDPTSLADVLETIEVVGRITGSSRRAESVVGELRARLARVKEAVAGRPRPKVLALEWSDPPYSAGHWVPEMIELAGGSPVLCSPRADSARLSWSDVATAGADVVVVMPCGFDVEAASDQAKTLLGRLELASADALFAANGGAYFSRPGPRLVVGVEALAWALHGAPFAELEPDAIRRLR